MKLLGDILIAGLLSAMGCSLFAFQRHYVKEEERTPSLPPNAQVNAEWTFARLHYHMGNEWGYGMRGFQRWAADYPKADRQFVMGVRRLTRLHARPIEEVVDANSNEMFDWPWIYVEDGGWWTISEVQAARMREYLLKGGFMMIDDSHGDSEWDNFMRGMLLIFPERPVEDLRDEDEIFHVMYDLDERFQIPGTRYIWGS